MKIGDIVYLEMYRGLPRDQICKVVNIRDLDKQPVKRATLWYNRITRSNNLIIVKDLYTDETFSVYDYFANIEKASLTTRFLYWLRYICGFTY